MAVDSRSAAITLRGSPVRRGKLRRSNWRRVNGRCNARDEPSWHGKARDRQLKIGGDASAAAGPVERTATAATDIQLHAEILSYSRTRGAFAGVALDGTVVTKDGSEDRKLYGHEVNDKAILEGSVPR